MIADNKPESVREEFRDPLENYDPKTYNDPLEEALMESTVAEIQATPYVSVSSETTIREAVARLAELQVACLLVEDEGRLVGVFTDRNVLDHVALEYEQVKDLPISEVMTKNPVFVHDTDAAAAALCVMAACGYRHVPVLDVNDKIVGIVSPQRVNAFLRRHYR